MAYELPPLPYPKDALEPYIDALTMEIHHDKHHGAYVTNVNKAIAGKPVTAATAEAAGKAAVAGAKPLSKNAHKVTLAKVAVKRALLEAVKAAKA